MRESEYIAYNGQAGSTILGANGASLNCIASWSPKPSYAYAH